MKVNCYFCNMLSLDFKAIPCSYDLTYFYDFICDFCKTHQFIGERDNIDWAIKIINIQSVENIKNKNKLCTKQYKISFRDNNTKIICISNEVVDEVMRYTDMLDCDIVSYSGIKKQLFTLSSDAFKNKIKMLSLFK